MLTYGQKHQLADILGWERAGNNKKQLAFGKQLKDLSIEDWIPESIAGGLANNCKQSSVG